MEKEKFSKFKMFFINRIKDENGYIDKSNVSKQKKNDIISGVVFYLIVSTIGGFIMSFGMHGSLSSMLFSLVFGLAFILLSFAGIVYSCMANISYSYEVIDKWNKIYFNQCPSCGKFYKKEEYCGCGFDLSCAVECSNCGALNLNTYKYCINCGNQMINLNKEI